MATAMDGLNAILAKNLNELTEADVTQAISLLTNRQSSIKGEIDTLVGKINAIDEELSEDRLTREKFQRTINEFAKVGASTAAWQNEVDKINQKIVPRERVQNSYKIELTALQQEQANIPTNLSTMQAAHAEIQRRKQEGITKEKENLSKIGKTKESVFQEALTDSALKVADTLVGVEKSSRTSKAKTALLITGGVVAIALIGFAIFLKIKNKKQS